MEVAPSALQILPEPLRRGTPLPLSQLVETSRSRASIPNHLVESKSYVKVKSNSLIQAEPAVLHFSGFEPRKEYLKSLKLINISSEVMNIHIIPTQTKHFQTTYTKKYRLIPGLAYTLKVQFSPDEWRYYYDCIRVHCKGEENLLIPVHAYPVIDDLHIPSHIDLLAVPLGQSVSHSIPLTCSCPIDFEFQVYVIQPNDAFSIQPLTGVIPANGELKVIVTFTPVQYGTAQFTIQLVISQFNTKPHLCTITGRSTPHLSLSHAASAEHQGSSPVNMSPHRSKPKHKSTKPVRDQTGIKAGLKPPVDVCSPAGVAKMLIKDQKKLSSRDLREVISRGTVVGLQERQMREALFIKQVQQNVKEEQANHLRWQVHLGKDVLSEQTRRQVLEEREIALHEYRVRRGDMNQEEDFVSDRPKLSSRRVLCEAGQAPEGTPSFQFFSSFNWELSQRAFRLFQQAARKVVIRCRVKRRLASVKKLCDPAMNPPAAQEGSGKNLNEILQQLQRVGEEETRDLNTSISSQTVFPFSFPVFFDEADQLAPSDLVNVPVDPVDVTVTAHIPFFKLQVPQHYKLMGYQPVSAWKAFHSYIPTTLARPLRTGAPNELVVSSPRAEEEQQQEHDEEAADHLTFRAPDGLLTPVPANPLRIFNPAPGLQTYKPTPTYLETDLEFHLCPLPRFRIPEVKNFLDQKGMIDGVMTWRNFTSITSTCLSNQFTLTSDFAVRRSVDYSADMLPLTAPPPPPPPPPDDPAALMDKPCDSSGVHLTPEMIRAEFLSGEALVANSNHASGATVRHQREHQTEAMYAAEFNRMGKSVIDKLKRLGVTHRTSHSPVEERE